MEKTYQILVLNDGDTYTAVDGCQILTITEKAFDMLENGDLEVRDIVYDSRSFIVHRITLEDS